MIKLLDKSVKNVRYVYSHNDLNEAEFLGAYTETGYKLNRKFDDAKNPPDVYLWALSATNKRGIPGKDAHIESHEIQLRDGSVGYWFSFE